MSTQLLSDYNSRVVSSRVAKKRVYSDIDLRFSIHPIKKSLVPLTDLDAVKQSVKNLVLTNFYERPFNPALGSGVRKLLFENADPFTALALKKAIVSVIHRYEPRVDNIVVQITDYADQNAYAVTIGFEIISLNTTAEIAISLERLR